MRPTLLLNPNGEKLYYKTDTLQAVYVKENVVLPEYVVLELSKSYVQEQVMVLAKGDIIPRLGLNEFKCLRIAIPNIARQALKVERKLVDDQKNLHFSKVNAELVALKDKQHEDYVKMLRQRKHRIGQLLGDLVPGFDTLDDFRKDNGGILKDTDVIAIKTGETVDDYFTILRNIINRIDTLVKNLTDREEWGKPSMIDIDDFLINLPNTHLKENFDFQFIMSQDVHFDYNEFETRKNIVLANESELSTVFENIIKNASKYGFTDEERNDYRIRISVDEYMIDNNQAVRICVSNNGTPIHPSLDRNRFFEWGYGNGDGIGTWQLKDIIEHYGGSIRLNEYPDEVAGFCTEYEIVLPLIIKE
jgi:signal transduction histidine kinase